MLGNKSNKRGLCLLVVVFVCRGGLLGQAVAVSPHPLAWFFVVVAVCFLNLGPQVC